jgi:hypothetical protein
MRKSLGPAVTERRIGDDDQGEGEKNGMIVVVRIKPPDEMNFTNFSIRSPGKNLIQLVSPHQADSTSATFSGSNVYQYDHVYWSTRTEFDQPEYASQEMIYQDIGISLVQNTLQGFNCSLFAYGQTVRPPPPFPSPSPGSQGLWQDLHHVRRRK